MKAIMYHYVRNEDKAFPHFKYLHFDNFRKQLDYFKKCFSLLNKEDFIDVIKNKNEILDQNYIVLTFDDGLIDHYSFVYPELKKRNILGIFFVSTGIYETKEVLNVHKIHYLLGRIEPFAILESLKQILRDDMLVDKSI